MGVDRMTEKQFRYVGSTDEVDEHIIDYSTEPHFEYYTLKGATDKLNELYEENEDLVTKKEDAEYELLHLKEMYEELLEENEQLKESVYSWSKSYNRVYEENTNIKHTIKTMIKTERTELGQSVLKQLWEQIE